MELRDYSKNITVGRGLESVGRRGGGADITIGWWGTQIAPFFNPYFVKY